MKMKFYMLSFLLFISAAIKAQPKIKLDTFSRSYPSAVDIANDGSTMRMFIVGQNGLIYVLDSNGVKLDTFIDLRMKVQVSSEQGLLGLAFHPDYANNGYFYTYYTKKNTTDNAVFRYKVSANPNRALVDSQMLVLNISHPIATNHNGGCLKFGVDGMLYISTGDGGGAGDIANNAQNKNVLLGKILRINVNRFDTAYTNIASNPFFGQANVKWEVWSLGLRNPWRFSFDRETHDMWIGDVGQGSWEEVDFAPASSTGGENYGWRCYEVNAAYNTGGCMSASNYVAPVMVYDHSANGGIAVTGGFVYRGNKYNDLKGYYVTADYGTGNFWVVKKNGATYSTTALGKPLTGANISAFGEDIRGEMYAANVSNGVIYRIRELCSSFNLQFLYINHPSCPRVTDGSLQMLTSGSNGNVSFSWSNNASGHVITNLGPGQYVVTATDAIGCVRKDSFTLRNLDTLEVKLENLVQPNCPEVSNGLIEVSGVSMFGGLRYNWSTGDTIPISDSLADGTYSVTVTDSRNCTKTESYRLFNADTLDAPSINRNGNFLETDPGFSYVWRLNGNIITGSTLDTLHPAVSGIYTVEITDGSGCQAISDTFTFIITGIKNIKGIEKISLYPNPASTELTLNLQFTSTNRFSLRIVNSIGQQVYEEKLQGKEFNKLISLKKLPAGFYELSLVMDDGSLETRAFVKE